MLGLCLIVSLVMASFVGVDAQAPPRFKFDAEWPKVPLPNKWRMGGVTGLTVDKDDNVWVLNRPDDLDETENYATLNPPTAECCVKPPTVIAFDRQGNVIASFTRRRGTAWRWMAQATSGSDQDTVRKYARDGKLLGEIARVPDRVPGGQAVTPAAVAAFKAKYPADTRQIVGGLEELRADDAAREIYAIDNYLNGRVMVYDMDTLQFKRGWGAYGKPLADISTAPAPRFDPSGPRRKTSSGTSR